ncbi:MAG: MerC domain-containing protein [Erythrobacter sp.]
MMQSTRTYDRAAALLSLSCVAHCIALPVLAVSLPFLGAIAEAEWVHWVLTALAIVASGMVFKAAPGSRSPAFGVPAAMGIVFITLALFAENFGISETAPTVIGGLLLAAAHIHRLYKRG